MGNSKTNFKDNIDLEEKRLISEIIKLKKITRIFLKKSSEFIDNQRKEERLLRLLEIKLNGSHD